MGANGPIERCRELRRAATDAEAVLWRFLRAHRFAGFKFRRQHPCGPFIVDFYCPRRKLAVELDGGQHFTLEGQAHDERRSRYLGQHGIEVLRFATDLVFRELEGVLAVIAEALGVVDGPSP
ncbi:MAG TPA: endonuclease domain-containing protein [Polyangia bacterium]|nr:endonuclease domain-containing protein [Polyangia bacterium]